MAWISAAGVSSAPRQVKGTGQGVGISDLGPHLRTVDLEPGAEQARQLSGLHLVGPRGVEEREGEADGEVQDEHDADPGIVTATARVDSAAGDPSSDNNQASEETEILVSPDRLFRDGFECIQDTPECAKPGPV